MNSKYIFLILMIFSISISCKKPRQIEQWNMQKMFYQEIDLFKESVKNDPYKLVALYIDFETNELYFFIKDRRIDASFTLSNIENKDYSSMKIYYSNDERFIGDYFMKIDTLISSNISLDLRIIIENRDVYFLGQRLELK